MAFEEGKGKERVGDSARDEAEVAFSCVCFSVTKDSAGAWYIKKDFFVLEM